MPGHRRSTRQDGASSQLRTPGFRPARPRLALSYDLAGCNARQPLSVEGRLQDEDSGGLVHDRSLSPAGHAAVAQLAVGVDGRQALVNQPHGGW